jgi:hypothetical protein
MLTECSLNVHYTCISSKRSKATFHWAFRAHAAMSAFMTWIEYNKHMFRSDQWELSLWEYTLLVTNGSSYGGDILYWWPMGAHTVRIFSTCDQWELIRWEYTLLVTNGSSVCENILYLWPMGAHTVGIYSTGDQWELSLWEYSSLVTNGNSVCENILYLWPMGAHTVGIYSTCLHDRGGVFTLLVGISPM